jgi:thimet oligopeptidase
MKLAPYTLALALMAPALANAPGVIPQWSAADVPKQCDAAIAAIERAAEAIEQVALSAASTETVLRPWNRAMIELGDFWGATYLLSQTHPDAAVRAANEACELRLSDVSNRLGQRTTLYARFKAVKPADGIDGEALRSILDEFEHKGVNLPPAKRKRAAAIFARLDKLGQDFDRNVRENKTRLPFTEAQLKGVPEAVLKDFKRDAEGRYLVGFDYPEYIPVMENAEDESTRRQLYIGFQSRGGKQNLAILQEVVNLRKQLATLMGYPSFAAWATRDRMAGSPKAVHDFLDQVKAAVTAGEAKDLAALRAEKATFTGQANATLNRWDVAFYETRLKRQRYSIDQREVRAAFPTLPTVDWMMAVTSRLYGLRFEPNAKLPVWHADVKGYDVFDAASGAYLSSFYLDLFPREGKYKHAAAFPIKAASTLEGHTPVAALVTNFNREGFDQEELDTLYHEFGHIMHGVLSRTRYSFNAGTSVKRDFVEAPSQMYEAWARDAASLKLWDEVCVGCKPIDPKLIERMNAARQFGRGTLYARQWLYAAYDMALHGPVPQSPQKLWAKMEGATALGHVKGTEFPGAFGHIVGGYAAGYYGYMWSEVLALDMRSAFGSNLMDPTVGMRFRKTILENGSQIPEADLVEQFLGRKPSSEAFFREITGQTPPVEAKP